MSVKVSMAELIISIRLDGVCNSDSDPGFTNFTLFFSESQNNHCQVVSVNKDAFDSSKLRFPLPLSVVDIDHPIHKFVHRSIVLKKVGVTQSATDQDAKTYSYKVRRILRNFQMDLAILNSVFSTESVVNSSSGHIWQKLNLNCSSLCPWISESNSKRGCSPAAISLNLLFNSALMFQPFLDFLVGRLVCHHHA